MRHLTEKDRYKIEFALKAKMPVKQIAAELGFSKVTIYAEIKRGTVKQLDKNLKEYYAYKADAGQRIHKAAVSKCGAKKNILQMLPCSRRLLA